MTPPTPRALFAAAVQLVADMVSQHCYHDGTIQSFHISTNEDAIEFLQSIGCLKCMKPGHWEFVAEWKLDESMPLAGAGWRSRAKFAWARAAECAIAMEVE